MIAAEAMELEKQKMLRVFFSISSLRFSRFMNKVANEFLTTCRERLYSLVLVGLRRLILMLII